MAPRPPQPPAPAHPSPRRAAAGRGAGGYGAGAPRTASFGGYRPAGGWPYTKANVGQSVARSHPGRLTPAQWLSTWTLLAVAAPQGFAAALDTQPAFGGNLAATTDYIYRGVSESDGAALQADLHGETRGAAFAGGWASTRGRGLQPGSRYGFDIYFGHRFELDSP